MIKLHIPSNEYVNITIPDNETELKEFPDYVYIESTKNTTGNMIADEVIEVVYKYAHISEGVLERHIDIETNEIFYENELVVE